MYIYYKNKWIQVDVGDEKLNKLSIQIGSDVRIGSNVRIGSDVRIYSVCDKYICNRYNNYIRIGCEIHTIEKWQNKEFQDELAEKHNEVEWWNYRGVKILQFLIENE